MFTVKTSADYALLLISELINKKEYIPMAKLVEDTHLPPRFIARIAADLVRNNVLQSKEGKDGGYKLMRDLKKLTLFEFLNIFNKKQGLVKCQKVHFNCVYGKLCNHKLFFKEVLNNIFTKELKKWTLADLLKN